MLENLMDLVKNFAGDSIINNPDIPNEHNDAAVGTVSNSIVDTLKNAIGNGKLSDVTSLLGGQGGDLNSNPLAQDIHGNVISNLMYKFNLNHGQASGIAGNLMPSVLQNLIHKTNDPNDKSFDLQGIIGSLTGGGGGVIGGLMDKVKGLFGN